jgi:hypothetical protein
MSYFKCPTSNVLLQMSYFKCPTSNVLLQMSYFKCPSSNVLLQMSFFKYPSLNVLLQMIQLQIFLLQMSNNNCPYLIVQCHISNLNFDISYLRNVYFELSIYSNRIVQLNFPQECHDRIYSDCHTLNVLLQMSYFKCPTSNVLLQMSYFKCPSSYVLLQMSSFIFI